MTLTTGLESLRKVALRDAEIAEDDVLLSKDLARLAERLAEGRFIEPVRLHNAMVGVPRAAFVAVAGEPGREEQVQVRATRVDLYVPMEGVTTLALLAEAGDFDLPGVEIDVAERRLVVGYVAQHPDAKTANAFFDEALNSIESEVGRVDAQVQEYNESLQPALMKALEAAKERAKARQKFAAGLRQPRAFERWGGKA
jgi:hypothetical protein